MNTTRLLDAYQYSNILLPTSRIISNLIRLSTVANLPLPLICRPTLIALPTTSTSLNQCLLVLNKPLQQLPQLSHPKPSASLRLHHPVLLPPVPPLPRLESVALIIPVRTNRKGKTIYSTPLQSRLTKVLSTRFTRSSSIPIVHLIIRTTVCSATLQFLTALLSARSVSLLSLLLLQTLAWPITPVRSCTLFGHKSSYCIHLFSFGVAKDAAKR